MLIPIDSTDSSRTQIALFTPERAAGKARARARGASCAFLSCALALIKLSGAPQDLQARERADRLGDYVRAADVVVLGKVLSVTTQWRRFSGPCADGRTEVDSRTDVRIAVRHLFTGVGVADTLTIVVLPGTGPRVGAEVVAWGFRHCGDGYRVWGAYATKSTRGPGFRVLEWTDVPARHAYFSIAMLKEEERRGAFAARRRSVSGLVSIGLFVVESREYPERGRLRATGTILRSVAGRPATGRMTIDSFTESWCERSVEIGDTLAIPLHAGDTAAGESRTSLCLSTLQVRGGHVRYFGRPIEDIHRLMGETRPEGFSLRGREARGSR